MAIICDYSRFLIVENQPLGTTVVSRLQSVFAMFEIPQVVRTGNGHFYDTKITIRKNHRYPHHPPLPCFQPRGWSVPVRGLSLQFGSFTSNPSLIYFCDSVSLFSCFYTALLLIYKYVDLLFIWSINSIERASDL